MTDDLAWETLDRETSYSCPGFDVVTDAVRFPDGSEGAFDYLAEGESVVILPLVAPEIADAGSDGDATRRVVVIEEWRQAVERVNRGLPAGSVEPTDADVAAAARRELTEETGYEAEGVEHLTTVEQANGFSDAVFHYVLATDCRPTGEQDLDENEWIRVETTALADLRAAARAGELRDGRTLLGVLYHALAADS